MKKATPLAAIALTLLAGGAVFASGGSSCTQATIEESFVLPDGSVHDAGQLTLCVTRRHSPVAFVHDTRVDGRTVGAHISRHSTSEGPGTADPYVMFVRGGDRRLHLVGYARPGGAHMDIFTLLHAASDTTDTTRKAGRVQEDLILVAALAP